MELRQDGRTAVAPGIAGGVRARDDAHAAEIVVLRGPAADTPAVFLQGDEGRLVDSRLRVERRSGRMEAGSRDRFRGCEPLVHDPGDDAEERGSEPRSPGGSAGEHELSGAVE